MHTIFLVGIKTPKIPYAEKSVYWQTKKSNSVLSCSPKHSFLTKIKNTERHRDCSPLSSSGYGLSILANAL